MSDFKFEAWPTEYRHINQVFGANPTYYGQFGLPGHEGIDIMAPNKSKIFAVAPGRIGMVHKSATGHNYGIHCRIDHEDGYQTIYAHLDSLSIENGQFVQAGQMLGLANDTGNSNGSHLHLTLKRKGTTQGNWPFNIIDPTPFLMPLIGWQRPAGPYTSGWAYTRGITVIGELAQAASGGINLRAQATISSQKLGLVPGGTIMIVKGAGANGYTPVDVATAAIPGAVTPPPPPPPPPASDTLDGWGWQNYLTVSGNSAIVGQYGINLRLNAKQSSDKIGLVRGKSQVTVLGKGKASYLPIRVRRKDFIGTIHIPNPPDLGDTAPPITQPPPAGAFIAWAWTNNINIHNGRATSGLYGITLRSRPSRNGDKVGHWNEGASGAVAGLAEGEYTPVYVQPGDVTNPTTPRPSIQQPTPLPGTQPQPPQPPGPEEGELVQGWVFSSEMTQTGQTAVAGQYGLNLRKSPHRTAEKLGFIPAGTEMIVAGRPRGEYTPVRLDKSLVQDAVSDPDPPLLGNALLGLHAAADPFIPQEEINEFKDARPGIIKLLSFHNPESIRKLVRQHPEAQWIVRAFLDFGSRNISPSQFFNDTIDDVRRTLNLLPDKNVVVELHNEPNLIAEGLGSSWADGRAFASWWLQVLNNYRNALPGARFIYPGLSPGGTVGNVRQDHIAFFEASRAAFEAADGVGIHLYWSKNYPMAQALAVLDDYVRRVNNRPLWVTEASNNKGGVSARQKGQEYITFWSELQKRPTVYGVTYFVASATNPAFADEVWVGRGIGAVVGNR